MGRVNPCGLQVPSFVRVEPLLLCAGAGEVELAVGQDGIGLYLVRVWGRHKLRNSLCG